MNNKKYRWFNAYEREKLSNLVKNQPVVELIYGSTDKGWQITSYKFLVDIDFLSTRLDRERKTIKNELIRGSITDIVQSADKETNLMIYSTHKSERTRRLINRDKQRWLLKINQCSAFINN